MDPKTLSEVQTLITDIWAAAYLLSRGVAGDYDGLDGLPEFICIVSDLLAGVLGLSSPVQLNEGEQAFMQLYRRMPEEEQAVLYQTGLSSQVG